MGRLNPPRLILIGYLSLILFGTFLLLLPFSTHTSINFVDALFTATSAVCVTGLIVKNTGADFTPFGKIVILLLIQIGGLGYMTVASFLLILARKRLSLAQTAILREDLDYIGLNFRDFVLRVILFTFFFEIIGFALLSWRFRLAGYSLSRSLFYGLFHSVSAFCNAGFSFFPDSFQHFIKDNVMILTIAILFIIGGLGFIVLHDIWSKLTKKKREFLLHSKFVFLLTLILIVAGTLIILASEWNNTLKDLPFSKKLLCSFFHAVTPRTAGFNVLPVGEFTHFTLLFTIMLMFVGASPGGTGGGIKTTTFGILLLEFWRYIKGGESFTIFKRRIREADIQRAISIFFSSVIIIAIGTLFLTMFEKDVKFIRLMFEEFSAFGTVGLSTGSDLNPACSLAQQFSTPSKIVIIMTMLIGRIGTLTFGSAFITREIPKRIEYPEEEILTG